MRPSLPDRIGIWKGWFLERGENRSTQRKTPRQGREPTTNLPFHIPEKGTPFGRSLPIKAITLSPTPRGSEASALTTVPLMLTFRQKPIHVLYLHKKVGSFMSISLIHKNHFAKFVPVHFLIQAKKVSAKIRYENTAANTKGRMDGQT